MYIRRELVGCGYETVYSELLGTWNSQDIFMAILDLPQKDHERDVRDSL